MAFQITRKELWEKLKELKGDEASPNKVPIKVFKSNAKEAFFNKLEFVFIDPGTLSPDTLNKIDNFLEGFVRNFKRYVAEFVIICRVVASNHINQGISCNMDKYNFDIKVRVFKEGRKI